MPSTTLNNKSIFYTITPQTSHLDKLNTTLLIHGLGSSSNFYHTIIPELSTKSTCIAFDTPGSGLSSLAMDGSPQTVASIVEDAVALLDALLGTAVMVTEREKEREKVWVVGHSMGGMIACELAVRYAQRVKGLILLGPITPSVSLAEVFEGVEPLADSIPFSATGSIATSLHHAFIRNLILGTTSAGYLSLSHVIVSAHKPEYAKIKVPLIILAGSDDKTAPYVGCEEILDSVGAATEKKFIHVIPGVGHWHAVEAPEVVAREILDFVDLIHRDGTTVSL
ncbi:hypothetical protein SBOR_7900 [Sclerotinia borealis F-4128]|uniref:AB hydrolase-1 domain-containing protein n=1 Tax=Sclerotinia borealis (strain F-4128) TaxID=1432307 RepID=W9CAW8_SCLBF|nr:hypothetical protein SBOR_7900 [Sclerotinia borealis F-4128]